MPNKPPVERELCLRQLRTGIKTLRKVYHAVAQEPDLLEVEINLNGEVTGPPDDHHKSPRYISGCATFYPLLEGNRIYAKQTSNRQHVVSVFLADGIPRFPLPPETDGQPDAPSGYGTGKLGENEMDRRTYAALWRKAGQSVRDAFEMELL